MEIILAIATLLGGITAIWFFWEKFQNYKKFTPDKSHKLYKEEEREALRNIEDNNHIKFIDSLPEEKIVTYANAQKKWDTGINSKMREGNDDVINFMKNTWLTLSEFYKSMNFEGKTSKQYIEDYIKTRSDYHWSKHMPNGEFNGGLMLHVMIGADVIADLDNLIIDLISTISFYNDDFDYLEWQKRWNFSEIEQIVVTKI